MSADYNNPKKYTKFKISDVSKPANGRVCMRDHYWVVTPDDCILLYGGFSWQCNAQEIVAKKIIEKVYSDCQMEYFDALYVPRIRE